MVQWQTSLISTTPRSLMTWWSRLLSMQCIKTSSRGSWEKRSCELNETSWSQNWANFAICLRQWRSHALFANFHAQKCNAISVVNTYVAIVRLKVMMTIGISAQPFNKRLIWLHTDWDLALPLKSNKAHKALKARQDKGMARQFGKNWKASILVRVWIRP